MKKILVAGIAIATLAVATASEITVNAKETYLVDSSADDFVARTNELNTIDRLRLDSGAYVEFRLGEGVEVTINKPMLGQTPNAGGTMVSRNATLIKKGPGRLNLYAPYSAGNEYYLAFDVQGGSIYLPQNYTASKSQLIRDVSLAANTTFTAHNMGTLQIGALTGVGTFIAPGDLTVAGQGQFDGRLQCTGLTMVRGQLYLTNPENSLTGGIRTQRYYQNHIGIVGFASQGSLAGASDFQTDKWNGEYIYLGTGGDTITNRIDSRSLQKDDFTLEHPVTLNAGAHGGATFTGGIRFSYGGTYPDGTPGVWPFVLDGSNTANEAIFSGKIQEGSGADGRNIFKLVKRGTGIWHLKYNSTSTWTGPLAVENGTFRFDTLAEAGVNCALGFATNLFNATYTNIYTDCGYAVMLGATNAAGAATEGTLEYTGSARARVTTRPIVVRTEGRIKSNAGMLDISDVSAKTDGGEGVAALALDGNAGITNILRGVADGDGTLSVVKDGTGDWMLAGEQDFSGRLEVNGGRLTLQNPNAHDYVYYRWLIKENGFASPIYIDRQTNGWSTAPNEVVIASVAAMNLYDSDGKEIMTATNMTAVLGGTETPATLAPGQVTYDKRFGTEIKDANINALPGLFDNLVTTIAGGNTSKAKFDAADSNSWVAIVWRMPEGSKRAVKFDYCQYYNATTGTTGGRGIVNSELQASVDGYSWDTVWSKTNAVIDGSWKWISDPTGTSFKHGGDVSLNTHPGLDLDRTVAPSVTTFHPGGGAVSVAPGAELVADGPFTVSNLCISASGAGTFKGMTFAENGLVEVEDMATDVELPASFVDVSGLENLNGWTVLRNGDIRSRLRLKVTEGGIYLCPPGTIISFR